MGKHRRHHNANSGFSVYRDNSIDGTSPYTGGSLDRVNPDFRVPANLPVPEIQRNRRVGDQLDEPFSYLFFEIDLNNNPAVDPDLEGWQIFEQENCVIKVPFQDGGVELSNTQPGLGPTTNISSTTTFEFYNPPDDAFDTSSESASLQTIVNTGPNVGSSWTGTNDVVTETDGTLLYINSTDSTLTGFNGVLSQRTIGMVADTYNAFTAGGQRNLSWSLIYATTSDPDGNPTVTYQTWDCTYDPVNQNVLSSSGQTTQALDPSDVESISQAANTFIDLTANGTLFSASRIAQYLADFNANNNLLYTVNTPPGYSGSFPNFPFVPVFACGGGAPKL